MPCKETQVYWHELPTPHPPWKTAEEMRLCVLESRRATAQEGRRAWHGGGSAASPSRVMAPRALLTRAQISNRSTHLRMSSTLRVERPALYKGVVAEPHATPLRVVNLIMEHLQQRLVTVNEAAEVVERVALHFSTLTQSSQCPPAGKSGGQSARPRRSRSARVMESVLSQTQTQDNVRGGHASSQSTATVGGAAAASLSLALHDSLVLSAIEEFCDARGLVFRRLTKTDLHGMRHRISTVEAVPHRRVVLLADRSDPVFAVMFGMSRRTTPEPFVVATLALDGKTPASLRRYQKEETRVTQLFCMAPAPVPWRRAVKNISISTLRDEFAVASIEVDGGEMEGPYHRSRSDALDAGTGAAPSSRKRRRNDSVELIGAEEEEEEEEDAGAISEHANDGEVNMVNGSAASAASVLLSTTCVPLEHRCLGKVPLFSSPSGVSDDDDAAVSRGLATPSPSSPPVDVEDPLLRLPRSEGATQRRNPRHRVWYYRLLPRSASDYTLRLHTDAAGEEQPSH
ncbi:class I transcription factor A, subunit 2 [Novymonas esmeraldas]|uniref:Class I transcription factor A, subunit 2 n=1 Tax=Novymonas esmeraldas TaxID=1808958 RepID=A0AAW0F3X3_9TRYP